MGNERFLRIADHQELKDVFFFETAEGVRFKARHDCAKPVPSLCQACAPSWRPAAVTRPLLPDEHSSMIPPSKQQREAEHYPRPRNLSQHTGHVIICSC